MDFTNRTETIKRLKEINYDNIPKPLTTVNYFYGNPNPHKKQKLYDCWLEWDYVHLTWDEEPTSIPVGLVCLDVETTNNTRTLAIASAVHMETGRLFSWYSNPSKYDDPNGQKLLDIAEGTFLVAHRSTFEASFIARNFVPGHPGFKSLCTYAISAALRHPGKTVAYRAAPFAPKFRKSSDCSLAHLYHLATGGTMDKTAVSAFIESKSFQWAESRADVLMKAGIYEAYSLGKAGSKFKKENLPSELQAAPVEKYPKVTKTMVKGVDPLLWSIPLKSLTEETRLFKAAVILFCEKNDTPIGFTYQVPGFLSHTEYKEKLQNVYEKVDPIKAAWEYNIFDTLATVQVIQFLIYDLTQMDDFTFAGMVERSTPMFFVDSKFDGQVNRIEDQFQEISEDLDLESTTWVQDHLDTGGDWDGQDWELNSDRCSAAKKGKPKWYDDKKLGFSKTLTAIALRVLYKGQPLKRLKTVTPVKIEDGLFMFRENPELKPRGLFSLVNSDPDLSYEENMQKADITNCTPFENPTSTDVKSFKGVGSLFSSKLLPYWVDGSLTCITPVEDQIKKFISLSYWRSIRKRIFNLRQIKTPYGIAISPRSHVFGTVTGRSVDPVFLVLAKHDKEKLGSELQGFFCAPKGYKIVHFDLDSAQARFAALISDADYAREKGLDKVKLMSTGFSKRIFKGNKKDLSTVAHELGRIAGYDYNTEKGRSTGYAKGKNAQFSLIFWVGVYRLAKMANISIEAALAMSLSFRGVQEKNGYFSGGEASNLFNGQIRMSNAEFPVGDGTWSTDRKLFMRASVWGRVLPYVLSPVYAGKEDKTTRYNATIQAGDVDFMNYICGHAAQWFNKKEIDGRFAHSVHDEYIWIIKDENVDDFVGKIREVHKDCYLLLFKTWGVDLDSVPDDVWYPQSIDVAQRWVKTEGDQTVKKSSTMSFDGFEGLEGDDDYDEREDYGVELSTDYI